MPGDEIPQPANGPRLFSDKIDVAIPRIYVVKPRIPSKYAICQTCLTPQSVTALC